MARDLKTLNQHQGHYSLLFGNRDADADADAAFLSSLFMRDRRKFIPEGYSSK
jgi:hypothetical protein